MTKFTASDEEAYGIVGYPVIGLYVLMRLTRKIIGGELVDEAGNLPVAMAAMRRHYPEADEMVVAQFDGSRFKVQQVDMPVLPFMKSNKPMFLTIGRPMSGKSRFYADLMTAQKGR